MRYEYSSKSKQYKNATATTFLHHTSNVETNVVRFEITVNDLVGMQVVECGAHVKRNVQAFGQEVSALLSDTVNAQGLVVVAPEIDLVLESALQAIKQQKVSTFLHTGKTRCSSRGHTTEFDNVGVLQ